MRINAVSTRIDIEHEITFTLGTGFESDILVEYLRDDKKIKKLCF